MGGGDLGPEEDEGVDLGALFQHAQQRDEKRQDANAKRGLSQCKHPPACEIPPKRNRPAPRGDATVYVSPVLLLHSRRDNRDEKNPASAEDNTMQTSAHPSLR